MQPVLNKVRRRNNSCATAAASPTIYRHPKVSRTQRLVAYDQAAAESPSESLHRCASQLWSIEKDLLIVPSSLSIAGGQRSLDPDQPSAKV